MFKWLRKGSTLSDTEKAKAAADEARATLLSQAKCDVYNSIENRGLSAACFDLDSGWRIVIVGSGISIWLIANEKVANLICERAGAMASKTVFAFPWGDSPSIEPLDKFIFAHANHYIELAANILNEMDY